MKIVESILVKNPCYKAGKKITVKGLMLHSVGCSQPKASVFVNRWNSAEYNRACVHGFIDANDGTIYQTLPWDHRGWHAGGYANNTHIGVEMCEPDCIKYTSGSSFTCSDTAKAKEMVRRTYISAVELFAFLCKKYNLDPIKQGVIISHKEGNRMGWSSDHGDPEHLWNQLKTGYTMDTFRKAVKDAMAPKILYRVQVGAYTVKENAERMADRLKAEGYPAIIKEESQETVTEPKPESTKKSDEEIAREVILGRWGNGSERKERLTSAGYNYSAIQKIVNELLR